MKQAGSHAPDAIARAILAYLEAHPQAADSADGIGRWWLGPQGVTASQENVEAALAQLVAQGRLRCLSLADGTLLYAKDGASP